MDRNYFYQKRAQEHQREISEELANRKLLNDGSRHDPLTGKQARRLVLRIAFVVIAFSLLALYLSG